MSFLPFKNPFATPDGTIFDLSSIVPYVQKYKRSPVDGEPMTLKQIIKLKFHKNHKNEYYCPILKKAFNEYSHIIAIRETGNVFSYEAYDELNRKLESYNDLLTEEPFDPKKILVLQNPKEPDRNINDFYFITNGDDINFEATTESTMNLTNSQAKLINKIQTQESTIKPETEYQNLLKRQKVTEDDKKQEDEEEKMKNNSKLPSKPLPPKTFVNPLKLTNPK